MSENRFDKPAKPGSIARQVMKEQEPQKRRHNFDEVLLGFSEEEARLEASRCLQCKKPLCVDGCPADVQIPRFIELVRNAKYIEAAEVIKETNTLPAVCGRVCPQEKQCEERCVLAKKFEPVSIGKLEMFVADYEREHSKKEVSLTVEKTGFSVGIVGGGPASIACAGDLIRMGHSVVVYEALHKAGGVLVYGIPEFRLSNKTVEYEIDNLKKLGVRFETNVAVGLAVSLDELLEKHNAVFVGTGAGLPSFLNIPGENLVGVYSANEYLTRVNLMGAYKFPQTDTPIIRHKSVAVLGGGNVAMDSCRTALRLGAERVFCVYRRTEEEMPARIEEIHHAKEEGVEFAFLSSPVEIIGDENFRVSKLKAQVMRLGESDESGRRRPVAVEGEYKEFDVDGVVVAIGNKSNPIIPKNNPEISVNKWGNFIVDEDMMSSKKGVFAGGDIARGAATVILAIGDGKKAAKGIDKYIRSL